LDLVEAFKHQQNVDNFQNELPQSDNLVLNLEKQEFEGEEFSPIAKTREKIVTFE